MSAVETRKANYKKFENEANCTPLVDVVKLYGKSAVVDIPSFIKSDKRYIENKYIPIIQEKYNGYEFECKVCQHRFPTLQSLGNHIPTHGLGGKEYYDAYLKQDGDGHCVVCGKPTKFLSISQGYRRHCCHRCCNQDPEFRKTVSDTIKSEEWQTANRQKMMEKFGVDSFSKTSEFKERVRNIFNATIEQFEKTNDCTLLWKVIEEYGQGWYTKGIGRRIQHGFNVFIPNEDLEEIAKYANTNHVSSLEVDIQEYLKKIYDGEIQTTNRTIIKPLELDLFMPDRRVAIEADGIYWHSTNMGTPKDYHLNKTKRCEQQGIRLIHIYDIDWMLKKDICQSLIASALGIYEKRIYARNCTVAEVDSKQAEQFLEDNHIQGAIRSSYRLGLFYKNELVQMICIGKSRFKKDEYELLRMCTKLHTQVVGGFSRLMKSQPYDNLVSYIDRSKFSGEGYLKTNFHVIDETSPSYFYWRNDMGRLNRLKCQKHRLAKLLGDGFDPKKTEQQNMLDNGFLQVYDCGNLKAVYAKEEASF